MKRHILAVITPIIFAFSAFSQTNFPIDTATWQINARSYVLENHDGKQSIYLQGGIAELKDFEFLNGTIEYDVYLTERQGFPGVHFRAYSPGNHESFFMRPHLSGKPDANQAVPVINGLTPWQLYFGPSYSFPYEYSYDRWTHVRLVVNGSKAQVFLDYAETPHLSWNLVHEPQKGKIRFGGGYAAMHYADFTVDKSATELVDFQPIVRKPIEGLVAEWQVSDMFEETLLNDPNKIAALVSEREWKGRIQVEEGTAANIAREQVLYNGAPGNTVFAKIVIHSDEDQIKLFEFGYSDRVVAILNNEAIYKGTNKWRSRDYRYLGTVGLFDGVYLDLKKGENILLLAVSEDFGGWLVTGKFDDPSGIRIE